MIVAHRGGVSDAPENSPEAFEGAIGVGADMVEFDVRRTLDSELVIFHDDQVGGRPLSMLTRRQLSELAGYQVLTLDETLEITRGRIKVDIELKENGYVSEVVTCLRDHGIDGDQAVITSFVDEVVKQCRTAAPEIRCGLLLGQGNPEHLLRTRYSEIVTPLRRLRAAGASFVAPNLRLTQMGVLRLAGAAGYKAFVWTVNERDDIAALLTDSRVEAIITDVPALALQLRADRLG